MGSENLAGKGEGAFGRCGRRFSARAEGKTERGGAHQGSLIGDLNPLWKNDGGGVVSVSTKTYVKATGVYFWASVTAKTDLGTANQWVKVLRRPP